MGCRGFGVIVHMVQLRVGGGGVHGSGTCVAGGMRCGGACIAGGMLERGACMAWHPPCHACPHATHSPPPPVDRQTPVKTSFVGSKKSQTHSHYVNVPTTLRGSFSSRNLLFFHLLFCTWFSCGINIFNVWLDIWCKCKVTREEDISDCTTFLSWASNSQSEF